MDICGFTPTNSLASASFDVLNISGVEDPLINVDRLSSTDYEESYFASAIAYINETRNEYTKAKITLYHAISEAKTQRVVLESFSDFFVKIKEIIDKFLKFIKSMFARFLTNLNKLIGSEKYLKKHKKDFDKFKSSDEFEFEGYNYTFSRLIPASDVLASYNEDLFKDDGFYGISGTNAISVDTVRGATETLANNLESNYDTFRGRVLGKSESIHTTDFSNELFKIYRDGEDTTKNVTVDYSYIHNAKDRFFNYSETKKHVDNQYKQIEYSYTKLKQQVEDMVKRNGDLNAKAFYNRIPSNSNVQSIEDTDVGNNGDGLVNATISGDLMTQLDIYVKAKVDQIQEYSNIHTMAFAAKLDAMSEAYKQDKVTLYTALARMQRTDSKRKEV